ncbi:hypothetical protein [Glutamicibacter creatinolyticus]
MSIDKGQKVHSPGVSVMPILAGLMIGGALMGVAAIVISLFA